MKALHLKDYFDNSDSEDMVTAGMVIAITAVLFILLSL